MDANLPRPYGKTLIVWWFYGKEHGGDDFQINPQTVIDAHIQAKIDHFRQIPEKDWRWWQVDEGLIVERPPQDRSLFGPDSCIYYLLDKGLAVIENVHMPPPDDRWRWYIHISDFSYDSPRDCWLMKDLFCDVVVEEDNRTYHLFDLPDMARALDVGLITPAQSGEILKRVDWVVDRISRGRFPFEAIQRARDAAKAMGW